MPAGLNDFNKWKTAVSAGGGATSANWQDAGVKEALKYLHKYVYYSNKDYITPAGTDPWSKVFGGTAAATVLGSWYDGNVQSETSPPQVYGTTYGAFACPGPDKFLGHSDMFLLTKGARHPNNAKKWLRLIGSAAAQDTFNPPFGSISPRIDSDTSKYTGMGQYLISELKRIGYQPRTENLVTVPFADDMITPPGKFALKHQAQLDADATDVDAAVSDLVALCKSSGLCSQ